jgi:hypothetical protein
LKAYIMPMDTMKPDADEPPEANDDRARSLMWEAAAIAKARVSAAAGRVVSAEAVDAWIDSLDTDHELMTPRSGR